MKRTLLIDGNFMMKRILRDETFIVDPEKDRLTYLTNLAQHFAAEMNRVKDFVDYVIVCKDSRSWRKDVKQVQPIDIETGLPKTESEYKANRKLSEDRDWSAIFNTFNEFCEILRDKFGVPVIQSSGAEGDDCIYVMSRILGAGGKKSAVYCTDSDLNQLVNPSTLILRRIKSNAAPEGEVVIDKTLAKALDSSATSAEPFGSLLFDVTSIQDELNIIGNKTIGSGLVVVNPSWVVLKQMICGSPKDNVPELFTWPTKSITRHISPSKHIEPALYLMGLTPDSLRNKNLYDEAFLKTLICNIISMTKQDQYFQHLNHLYSMVLSNRKMNALNKFEIPEEVISGIQSTYEIQSDTIGSQRFSDLQEWNLIAEAMQVDGDIIFRAAGIY